MLQNTEVEFFTKKCSIFVYELHFYGEQNRPNLQKPHKLILTFRVNTFIHNNIHKVSNKNQSNNIQKTFIYINLHRTTAV